MSGHSVNICRIFESKVSMSLESEVQIKMNTMNPMIFVEWYHLNGWLALFKSNNRLYLWPFTLAL